jgi:N utilization substance protein B
MGSRRRSRELALQALFYMDMRKNRSEEMLKLFVDHFIGSEKPPPFFEEIVRGVIAMGDEIDLIIKRFSSKWKLNRMPCVDRNILRLAAYELLYCDDVPAKVSINEAIDIGKKFGAEDSGAFINGILDSIRIEHEKDSNSVDQTVC